MKIKNKNILLKLILLTCLLNSCQKEPLINSYSLEKDENQKVVNKLVGTWRVIHIRINNESSFQVDNIKLFFNHCNSRHDTCSGEQIKSVSNINEFRYLVYDNGNSLKIFDIDNNNDTLYFDVVDINSYNLVLEYEENGDVIKKVYRRTENN
jgi:hypothetical protein